MALIKYRNRTLIVTARAPTYAGRDCYRVHRSAVASCNSCKQRDVTTTSQMMSGSNQDAAHCVSIAVAIPLVGLIGVCSVY